MSIKQELLEHFNLITALRPSMIEEALERRAEREAKRINVEVVDSTVTLSGAVRSWAEKRAILGAVSHAPGVRTVEESLFVDPLV